jgi:hypothetical protein
MPNLADPIREYVFRRMDDSVPDDIIVDEITEKFGLKEFTRQRLIRSVKAMRGGHTKGQTPMLHSKKEGQIYFIQGEATKNIKIGFSDDPKIRLKGHQTGSGEKLILLKTVKGCKADETEIHNKLRHFRIHGEWFKPERELLDFIEACKGFSD